MYDNMRVFIAIDLDKELINKIMEIESELKGNDIDVKFVEPENLHLTLKFLGEVGEDKIPEIEQNISRILGEFKQFRMRIDGFGYFGKPDYIRTLWLGIKEGKEEIIKIIKELNKTLNHIRKDDYDPSPHLTIGRVKSGKNKELLLHEVEGLKDVNTGEMVVNEIKLKQSVLTKKGPEYSDLRVFHF